MVIRLLAYAFMVAASLIAASATIAGGRVVVFAAASTTEAVTALAERFGRRSGIHVVPSFAASSTLARQIELGAPADIYIAADRRWMAYLAGRGLIDGARTCELARNRLVLVTPRDRAPWPAQVRIAPGMDLTALLDGGRLAMADPDHVPAGMYGRQALETLGVWPEIADRLVRSADVRGALALVARGEAAAGIVYATDARISTRVRVAGSFPAASHDAIVYPVAPVGDTLSPGAAAFFDYAVSAEGRAVLAEFGFDTDEGPACSP